MKELYEEQQKKIDGYFQRFVFPVLRSHTSAGLGRLLFQDVKDRSSYPFLWMGLSSSCPLMRALRCLPRASQVLFAVGDRTRPTKNDKLLLKDFIATLRQSLSTAINTKATEGSIKGYQESLKLPSYRGSVSR
ncbi:unnamed protein product [Danaus chrysippus]|uniref:(African queen) hypothetical protein n=1 Tax=Danaus chrysippus TaxID=151541 RepID=A0A8J2QN35_9NEOP|nr:unnamed protein product [Danaus chrysippus]